MKIITITIQKKTKGQGDLIDLTPEVRRALEETGLKNGTVVLFVTGSTAGITTIEYEPGLVKDLNDFFQNMVPYGPEYAHHAQWGDDNGSSHVRAALLGPSLTVPFVDGKMVLGTWQQVVLAEFDTRSRDRQVTLQFTGE